MKVFILIVIFEDGSVELCKVQDRKDHMNIIPFESNLLIVDDFKIACTTGSELLDEIKATYQHIEYITLKAWTNVNELLTGED